MEFPLLFRCGIAKPLSRPLGNVTARVPLPPLHKTPSQTRASDNAPQKPTHAQNTSHISSMQDRKKKTDNHTETRETFKHNPKSREIAEQINLQPRKPPGRCAKPMGLPCKTAVRRRPGAACPGRWCVQLVAPALPSAQGEGARGFCFFLAFWVPLKWGVNSRLFVDAPFLGVFSFLRRPFWWFDSWFTWSLKHLPGYFWQEGAPVLEHQGPNRPGQDDIPNWESYLLGSGILINTLKGVFLWSPPIRWLGG